MRDPSDKRETPSSGENLKCRDDGGQGTHAIGVAGDGQQIADCVVLVCRDMALFVDHLRQPAQVVGDVLGLVSNHRCGYEHTEHQHAGHKRQDFGQRHLLHPQTFISDEKSLSLLAHIIHERFRCNRGFAAQDLDILFQVCLRPSRLRLPVSPGNCAISRRTVMNNVG